jgi:hypothetical protein
MTSEMFVVSNEDYFSMYAEPEEPEKRDVRDSSKNQRFTGPPHKYANYLYSKETVFVEDYSGKMISIGRRQTRRQRNKSNKRNAYKPPRKSCYGCIYSGVPIVILQLIAEFDQFDNISHCSACTGHKHAPEPPYLSPEFLPPVS